MMLIRTVGIVGCGIIGSSWTAFYLAQGFDVRASDPDPRAESRLCSYVGEAWPALTRLGLAPGASLDRLHFYDKPSRALHDVDFVQESGPERLDDKRTILAEISDLVRPDVIIASSSSGLLISEIQDAAARPERIVLGHPFNPPHLIPLVEVLGGRMTSPKTIDDTLAFYRSLGKRAIHVRREMKGHLANRLQAALWREAFSLVAQGVATVEDVDLAISEGPGLRWGLSGPFLNMHLSGGIRHYLDHLGPAIESWWADLGETHLTQELKDRIAQGITTEVPEGDRANRGRARDALMLELLLLKRDGAIR